MSNGTKGKGIIEPEPLSPRGTVRLNKLLLAAALSFFFAAAGASALTTAFTFQGRLNDSGTPANGSYDMQLKLFDNATVGSGAQIGSTITRPGVKVTGGGFTVELDFTAAAFPGADRFLEVGIKPAGSGSSFTILGPRQPITPAPYAIYSANAATATHASTATNASNATHATSATSADKATTATSATNATKATTATNATELGGVAAANYVQTTDARLSNARPPTPGSTAYIQNTTTQEAGGFNISGNGVLGGVGIGKTPDSGYKLDLAGTARINPLGGTYTGSLAFGTPSGETGISIFPTGSKLSIAYRADLRFDGSTLKLVAGVGGGPPVSTSGIAIDTQGNVGIGTTTPVSKLDVVGQDALRLIGYQPFLTLYDSNAGYAGGRIQVAGGDLNFFTQSYLDGSNGSSFLKLANSGYVGIGTLAPDTPLSIVGGPLWTAATWTASMGLRNASALGWEANSAGNHFGIGQSDGGLYFFHSASGFGDTASGAIYDMIIPDSGQIQIGNSTLPSGLNVTGRVDVVGQSHFSPGAGEVGTYALSASGVGNNNSGIYAKGSYVAGYFEGNVYITGKLTKGSGSFKIDHPLDPKNKYLYHSFVESPDMMNIYNGNVTTDAQGLANIILPDWFEALNQDFRYQLTVIGQFAQAIVSEEINGNQFTIRSDKPNVKVSWQVTGIRHDKFAADERIPVEEDKSASERGNCLYAPACQ